MSASLRIPEPADYEVITSWVPDADSCLRWAGPRVRFPFTAAELPRLLAVADGHRMLEGEGNLQFSEQTVALRAGDGIFIPEGEEHKHLLHVVHGSIRVVLLEDLQAQ